MLKGRRDLGDIPKEFARAPPREVPSYRNCPDRGVDSCRELHPQELETCEAEGRLLKEFARAPPREIPIRRKCTGRGTDRILDILQGLRPVRLIFFFEDLL